MGDLNNQDLGHFLPMYSQKHIPKSLGGFRASHFSPGELASNLGYARRKGHSRTSLIQTTQDTELGVCCCVDQGSQGFLGETNQNK